MKRKKSLSSIANSLTSTLNDCREDYPKACALTDDYIQSLPETNRSILTNNLKTPELITSGILVAGMGTLFYTTAPSTFFSPFYVTAKKIEWFEFFSKIFIGSIIVFFAVEFVKILITSDTMKTLKIHDQIESFLRVWEKIKTEKPHPAIATREVQARITSLNLDNACKYQQHIGSIFRFGRFCTLMQGLTIITATFSAGWIEQTHKQSPDCFEGIIPGDPKKAAKCEAEITLWQTPSPKPRTEANPPQH